MTHRPTPLGLPSQDPRPGQRGPQASGRVTRFLVRDVRRGLVSCDQEAKHMTQQKKLKKAVRARSQKTGESYTAARRHVVLARAKKAESPKQPAAPPAPSAAPAPAPPRATKSRGEV